MSQSIKGSIRTYEMSQHNKHIDMLKPSAIRSFCLLLYVQRHYLWLIFVHLSLCLFGRPDCLCPLALRFFVMLDEC